MNLFFTAIGYTSSMIVDDLNVMSVSIRPPQANTPLVVNADPKLALPIPREFLQSIPGWHVLPV